MISNVIVQKDGWAKLAKIVIFVIPIHAKMMGAVQIICRGRYLSVNAKMGLKVKLAPSLVSEANMDFPNFLRNISLTSLMKLKYERSTMHLYLDL